MSAVVMARRALQAFVLDKGAPVEENGRPISLVNQIRWLGQHHRITPQQLRYATAIRCVGNAGAHPDENLDDITHQDALDTVEVADHLLTAAYDAEAAADRIAGRRGLPV